MYIEIDVKKTLEGNLDLFVSESNSSGCHYVCAPDQFGETMQKYLTEQSSVLTQEERSEDDPKYIACEIMFKDDRRTMSTIIKSDEVVDEYDEQIFFYGKSLSELKEAEENETLMENEWYVLLVLDWSDNIEELIF